MSTLSVEFSYQFRDGTDAFGSFGFACLAHFGLGSGAFQCRTFADIQLLATLSGITDYTTFADTRSAPPGHGEFSGLGSAPDFGMFSDEFCCSHWMGPPSTQASQVRLAAHLNFRNLQYPRSPASMVS